MTERQERFKHARRGVAVGPGGRGRRVYRKLTLKACKNWKRANQVASHYKVMRYQGLKVL
jgi:hypothetical protein